MELKANLTTEWLSSFLIKQLSKQVVMGTQMALAK
jgi:hypothetical protein